MAKSVEIGSDISAMELQAQFDATPYQRVGETAVQNTFGELPTPHVDPCERNKGVNPIYQEEVGPLGPGATYTNIGSVATRTNAAIPLPVLGY